MRRITMDDVAEQAGVSRSLVSLAYRDAFGVNPETRQRILEVGERLGYVPNRVAASLAGRGGDTLGLFLQDLHNDVFADIHDGVREIAEAEGKHLVLAVGSIDGARDSASVTALRQSRVDVLIAAGLQLPDLDVALLARSIPLVTITRRVDAVDGVISDNYLGARKATEHLLELGHRRIAFLANPPGDGYRDRAAGYEIAMRSAGLKPFTFQTTYSREQAALDAAKVLEPVDAPTAVFAHNDQAALGVLDTLAARGQIAGRDVSVVGYDNSSLSRFPGTALTTVDVHSRALGVAGAELALRRLEEPTASVLLRSMEPSLIVRSTTGRPLTR